MRPLPRRVNHGGTKSLWSITRQPMPVSYGSLLDHPLRWPTEGDRPFATSTEWMADAVIEGHAITRLRFMTDGYKVAADSLIQKATEDRGERDLLVFPIIFCYRHFLEPSLKEMLAAYGHRVGVGPDWKSHALEGLWWLFVKMLNLYKAEDAAGLNTDPHPLTRSGLTPLATSPVDGRGKFKPSRRARSPGAWT